MAHPIDSALPCALRDRELVREMRTKLHASTSYMLDVAESGLNQDLSAVRQRVEFIRSGAPLSSTAYAFHDALQHGLQKNDPDFLSRLFSNVEKYSFVRSGIILTTLGANDSLTQCDTELLADTYHRRSAGVYSIEYVLGPPSERGIRPSLAALDYSLHELPQVDDETFRELCESVSEIMVVKAGDMNAASCFNTYGLIFVSEFEPNQSWTRYFEHIVHESAHYHVFAVCTVDPLVDEPDKARFKSPFRSEPRPAYAIYHAMFVLSRTIHVFRKMRKMTRYAADLAGVSTSYNNAGNDLSFEDKFKMTYDVLKNDVRLTDVGGRLLESCREMAFD
ncbi:MAG: HEXXH motif-containing putative peptide modification protein [Pseudolabrys sp.]